MRGRVLTAVIGSALALSLSFMGSDAAHAASGSCWFHPAQTCSVGGLGAYGTNDILVQPTQRRGAGDRVLTTGVVNSKTDFIRYVQTHFNAGGQEQVGVRFIVASMLGSHSWPDAGDLSTWVSEVGDNSVSFSNAWGARVTTTSWFDPGGPGSGDVFFASHPATRDLIQISQTQPDGSTKVLIRIERDCGNTTEPPRVLRPRFLIHASGSIDKTTAYRGEDTVKWDWNIWNSGPERPDVAVTAKLKWTSPSTKDGTRVPNSLIADPARCGPTGGLGKPAAGSPGSNNSTACSSSWTIPRNTPLGLYCQQLSVVPGGPNGATLYSPKHKPIRNPTDGRNYCVQVKCHTGVDPNCMPSRCVVQPGAPTFDGAFDGDKSQNYDYVNQKCYHCYTYHYGYYTYSYQEWVDTSHWEQDAAGNWTWVAEGHYETQWQTDTHTSMSDSPNPAYWQSCNESWELVPTVSADVDDGEIIYPSSEISIGGKIENTGTWPSGPAQWQITVFKMTPGASAARSDKSALPPCAYYGGTCLAPNPVASGAQSFPKLETVDLGTHQYTIPDDAATMPIGSKVCVATSVQPNSSTNSVVDVRWSHSDPICVIVGKGPFLHVEGGDVRANGSIASNVVVGPSGRYFGSWVEYASFSVGSNNAFASAAGLRNGSDSDSSDAWSNLTVTNSDEINGNFSGAQHDTALAGPWRADCTKSLVPGSVDPDSLTSGYYHVTGDIDLQAATLSPVRSIVLCVDGKATLAGNIQYTSLPLTSLKQMPQLVIIAKDIVVNDGVSRLDAWLIADGDDPSGTVATCASAGTTGAGLSANRCDTPLTINGPVYANRFFPYRTSGGQGPTAAAKDTAGETINYNPAAYLWVQQQRENQPYTASLTDLPPRY